MAGQQEIVARVHEVYRGSGLSKAEFARRIGIDGPKLAKSLTGSRKFSSLELALIADLGSTTVDWLVTGDKPVALALSHRTSPAAAQALDEVAGETITRLHERVDGLRRLGCPLPTIDLPPVPSTGGWVAKSVALAEAFSKLLGQRIGGLSNSELFDLVEERFGIEVVVEKLPPGCDGASFSDDGFRGIVLAASDAPFRQRFTLGHEIGHIAFGHSREAIIEGQIDRATTLPEKMANTFAASWLAPAAEIRRLIGKKRPAEVFDDLVLHFQLSPSSMSWRLLNEDLITERQRQPLGLESARRIAMRSGQAAEFTESARQSELRRSPTRLVNAYLDAYTAGVATLRPAAALLGCTVDEVQSFFYEPSPDDMMGKIEG